MPVIINDFEVINDEPTQPPAGQRSQRGAHAPAESQPSPTRIMSLARHLRMLQARRARLHAD